MKKYLILIFVCLLLVFDSKAQVEITSAGTSSAYTLNVPGVFPLRNGIQVTFKAHTTCTASPTMNVSGTGALPIRKEGASYALTAGDIKVGQIVTLAYDGTNWQMLSQLGSSVAMPSTYWDPNGSDIYNNNAGNVGVGITTPGVIAGSTKYLSVASTNTYSTDPVSFELIGSNTSDVSPVTRIDFIHASNGPLYDAIGSIQTFRNGTNKAGSLSFQTADGSGAVERMRIDNKGNVGIGTSAPAANLQLYGTASTNMSIVSGSTQKSRVYFGSTSFAFLGAVEYDNSSNSMNFWTNNTPNRIYIDNGGKVGIGNSSPTATLDVSGNARISSLVGPGTVIADASGNLSLAAGTTITGSGTNNYLARWTPSGSQLGVGVIYDNGTNLGIGTTSPTNILSFGNASDRKIWIEGSVGNTVGRALTISSGNSGAGFNNVNGGDMIIQAGVGTGTGSSSIIFQNGTTLGNSPTVQTMSTKMVILGNGNVGIGTTAPNSPLSVGASNQFQVDVNGNLIRINNVTLSWPAANGSGFLSNNGSGTLTWSTAGVLAGGTTNYVPKWTAANALSSTSLIFDNGTTVGINTAAPSAASKLHVVGAGNGSTLNVEDNSLSNGSVLYLSSTSTGGTASNNSRMITIARSGANTNASHTAYGLQSSITNTGTTSTNIAGYFSSTGATNNYAIIVPSSSGTVGIGTTAPDDILHVAEVTAVYDGSTGTYIDVQNSDGTANNGQLAGLRFRTDGVSAGANARFKGAVVFQKTGSWGVGDILFLNNSAASNASVTSTDEKMRITSGGNVGIGTTTPGVFGLYQAQSLGTNAKKMTISGMSTYTDDAPAVLELRGSSFTDGDEIGVLDFIQRSSSNIDYNFARIAAVRENTNATYSSLRFYTRLGATLSEAMQIDENGYVGIGTITPGYNLHVQKDNAGTLAYFDNNSVTGGTCLSASITTTATGAGTRYGVYSTAWYGQGLNYGVYGYGYGGTTAYGVYGTAGGGSTASYGVYCAGSGGYTGTWSLLSDLRFKENIKPLTGALDKVLLLEPKTYNLKSEEYKYMNFPTGTQIGLIAQDVEKVIPELVEKGSNPGELDPKTGEPIGEAIEYKTMNYIGLTPVLIQAIKEQQAQIEELKKQLEVQKKKIEALDKK